MIKVINAIIGKALVSSILLPVISFAQETKPYVFNIFRSTQLVNVQTTEVLSPGGFEFVITHRFGMIGTDKSIVKQFLGLDLPSNIRIGFALPLTERLYIGCGRTKHNKTVDAEGKYLLFRQTEDNEMPVSIAAYFNGAVGTDEFPDVPAGAYFSDSITPFSYKFPHRLSYNSQIIIGRKFTEKFSFQLAPVFIYKNLVNPGDDNYTIALPVSGIFKTGTNSSLIFEYAYRFNNRPAYNAYPLSIAWEFGTVGHIFQIVISSTNEIIEQDIYTKNSFNYLKGNFTLGFNIKRTFWRNTNK